MKPDRRDELAKTIQRGSQIKPPRRCARCRRVLKHEEASDFCLDCAHAAQVEVVQEKLRAQVLERDGGICAECGMYCVSDRELLDGLLDSVATGLTGASNVIYALSRGRLKGFPKKTLETKGATLWQADHIDPAVRGGPSTLENARTLCLRCHAEATKKLAGDRAASRRPGGRRFR